MTNNVPNAVSAYDGYWLAAYQEQEPNRESFMAIQIVTMPLN